MTKFVVVVKTAKESPLWKGLPPDYPVMCEEFFSYEEAKDKHPDKQVFTIEKYKEHSKFMHSTHPFPDNELGKLLPLPFKRRWWRFWKWF